MSDFFVDVCSQLLRLLLFLLLKAVFVEADLIGISREPDSLLSPHFIIDILASYSSINPASDFGIRTLFVKRAVLLRIHQIIEKGGIIFAVHVFAAVLVYFFLSRAAGFVLVQIEIRGSFR